MIPWKTASDTMNSCVEVARAVVWAKCAGGDCIEVARGDLVWARCGNNSCLEAVRTTGDHGRVLVRDSKEAPDYHVQQWTPREWAELLRAVRIDAEHPAVQRVDDGSVLLGHGPAQPIHEYTEVEWDAFTRGALKGMFEYEGLPDMGEWVQSSSCNCGKLSSSADGSLRDGPSAGREGLDTGQTSTDNSEARHGHDPAPNPESRVLPVVQTDQAATGATVTVPDSAPVAAKLPGWVERQRDLADASLDDALDLLYSPAGRDSSTTSEVDAVATTGQSGSEAGTGLTPGPVPAAEIVESS